MRSVPRINVVVPFVVLAVAGVCASGCGPRAAQPPAPVTMRIGVGAPRAPEPAASGAVINLLKADTWFSVRPDGRVTDRIALESTWE